MEWYSLPDVLVYQAVHSELVASHTTTHFIEL